MLIYMLGNFQIGPEAHSTGEVVNTSEREGLDAIKWGSARLATPEDLAGCKNPLPAALVRKSLDAVSGGAMISEAIPDGPRPHRSRG